MHRFAEGDIIKVRDLWTGGYNYFLVLEVDREYLLQNLKTGLRQFLSHNFIKTHALMSE